MVLFVAGNTNRERFIEAFRKTGLKLPAFAERIGEDKTRVSNWIYQERLKVPDTALARALALVRDDVKDLAIPAPNLKIPIPYIGEISASEKVDWTEPSNVDSFIDVPNEMGDLRRDHNGRFVPRFACRVVGDSMIPLLYPEDVLVFEENNVPKIGIVVMYRSQENLITVKVLKHDGARFILKALNPMYEDMESPGVVVGHLVGIVRESGSRKTTEYDYTGIRP